MAKRKLIHGRAPRNSTLADRLAFHSLHLSTGCVVWRAHRLPKGYGIITWRGKARRTHRLAWELANGPIPCGLHVLHKCDVPACINPDHLWLGTNADNVADKVAKGRTTATLGAETIRAIRESGATQRALADIYGVDQSMVSLIKARKRFSHVA